MGRRLYVGNLPYKATDEELTTLFSTVGDVASARVMRDMATGRARGFGFVEMTTDEAAASAIEKLHQHQMDGRAIVVNEAQPKPAGGGRNFGGGGGGFNRGGGSRTVPIGDGWNCIFPGSRKNRPVPRGCQLYKVGRTNL